MKKLSPVFLILPVVFLFISCGNKNEMKQEETLKHETRNTDSVKTNTVIKGDTSKIFHRELENWYIGNGEDYNVGRDTLKYNGKSVFYLASNDSIKNGWGGMIAKDVPSNEYMGNKVKLTGYIKTENIDDWAGMYMRVDSKEESKVLAFDNMQDRPIKGTTPWTKYEIVLGVSDSSRRISYGAFVTRKGKLFISGFNLEITDKNLPAKQ